MAEPRDHLPPNLRQLAELITSSHHDPALAGLIAELDSIGQHFAMTDVRLPSAPVVDRDESTYLTIPRFRSGIRKLLSKEAGAGGEPDSTPRPSRSSAHGQSERWLRLRLQI